MTWDDGPMTLAAKTTFDCWLKDEINQTIDRQSEEEDHCTLEYEKLESEIVALKRCRRKFRKLFKDVTQYAEAKTRT